VYIVSQAAYRAMKGLRGWGVGSTFTCNVDRGKLLAC
jgi:hypothetical protein